MSGENHINPNIDMKLAKQIHNALQKQKNLAIARKAARVVLTKHPEPHILSMREKLEAKPADWLKAIFPATFDKKWGQIHKDTIKDILTCYQSGSSYAMTMPRATGKSALNKALSLFAVITGMRKFIVAIGSNNKNSMEYYNFWFEAFANNIQLHYFYPELTEFFRKLEGKAVNAQFQLLSDGTPTGIEIKPDMLVLPTVYDQTGEAYRWSGAVLCVRSILGKIRGLSKTTKDGGILRPDACILDDIQSDGDAKSESQTDKLEEIILGSVYGLGGNDRSLPIIAIGSIQRKGDIYSRLVDHDKFPQFAGSNTPMFYNFPQIWDDGEENNLWEQYKELWAECQIEKKGQRPLNAFYRKHRKEMDRGAKVSWKYRLEYFEDPKSKGKIIPQISAIQCGMQKLFFAGEKAFANEYQGEPLELTNSTYKLTTDIILSKMSDIPPYVAPHGHQIITAYLDVNKCGINYAVCSYDQQMTCQIIYYGKYPERGNLYDGSNQDRDAATQLQISNAVTAGIQTVLQKLDGSQFILNDKQHDIDLVLVDRGDQAKGVCRAVNNAKRYSFSVLADWGMSAAKYKITKSNMIGRPGERMYKAMYQEGHCIRHDADYWREISQRSWLAQPYMAGGTMICKAQSKSVHMRLAQECSSEFLKNKYSTDAGDRYEWGEKVGGVHDLGDCLTGCWVAASWLGFSPSGKIQIKKKPQQQRQVVRHIAI